MSGRQYTERFPLAFTRMLSDARIDAGITRERLAHHLGCTAKTIERHELGETAPSLQRVAQWLAFCGVRCVLHTFPVSGVADTPNVNHSAPTPPGDTHAHRARPR